MALDKWANMTLAMYILYGPLTTLTLTIGEVVHDFVFVQNIGISFCQYQV